MTSDPSPSRRARRLYVLACLTAACLLLSAGTAKAYVGPGAGFVLAPLFLSILAGLLVVVVVLGLPFIIVYRLVFRAKVPRGPVKRVVVIGLDGMDPELTRGFMEQGLMPNFSALAEEGTFSPLKTSVPSISPCAWSSFMTGTDASRHSIYDFITRDPCTYLPILSSARVGAPKRSLKLGKYRIPLGGPVLTSLRKSKPFWHVLGENHVFSSILRVPITFPAQKFRGTLLSGMCVPDLRGTQGSFSFFTTSPRRREEALAGGYGGDEGGVVEVVPWEGDGIRGEIRGPKNTMVEDGGSLTVPFTARVDRDERRVHLVVCGRRLTLVEGEYSPWVRLTFRPGLGLKVHGIVRFLVTTLDPDFGLYVTPIQVDPERPALPISHPKPYSAYLARVNGTYGTLGLAEDTWALNERILDEKTFLDQAMAYHEEREKQLRTALATTRKGCVTVVFDTMDRIQHMFYRTLVPDHPANEGKDVAEHESVIRDLHVRIDRMLGEVRGKLDDEDALIVLSDHGFTSFSRGVNLNTWLARNGYLALEEGRDESGNWFEGVDFERTRAFGLGLTGLFLNRRGREAKGIVTDGEEAGALKREIVEGLSALTDPATGKRVIRTVYDADEIYSGPYRSEAPDLVVGYEPGYRNSWEGAVGRVTKEVVTDNKRSWSGDHCVDPEVVPGVLFSNLALDTGSPRIEDLAPTILGLLGVEAPEYMTGRSLLPESEEPPSKPEPSTAGAGR